MRGECGGDVFGEVVVLWTFGFNVDRDGVADGEAAAAQPGRAEGEPESVPGPFDHAPHGHVVDCAGDMVAGLGAPDGVRVKRDRDEDPAPGGGGGDRAKVSTTRTVSANSAGDVTCLREPIWNASSSGATRGRQRRRCHFWGPSSEPP